MHKVTYLSTYNVIIVDVSAQNSTQYIRHKTMVTRLVCPIRNTVPREL